MEEELSKTEEGQARIKQAEQRQNDVIEEFWKKPEGQEMPDSSQGQGVHTPDGLRQEEGVGEKEEFKADATDN